MTDNYIVILTIIGFAAFSMAFMPTISKHTGISYAIIYVALGVLIYLLFPKFLPNPLPQANGKMILHFTELVVIISLMGTGIKIDRSFSFKKWSSPLRLISLAMLLCILASTLLGYYFVGLDLASAILLAAVLAPTDPVLAADVQVGPPNESKKSETKFALTAEAGLNDGMAFPFTWLAIALMAQGDKKTMLNWLAFDLVLKILIGLAIGYLLGKLVGYLVFTLSKKVKLLNTNDGFLAISLTLAVYGLTELAHGYGFIAVFIAAITLRHSEKTHDYHEDLHAFTDQIERLLVAVLLLAFGGSLTMGILAALTVKTVIFALAFLFIIRPIAGLLSLYGSKMYLKEKLAISFFGIRGMGSIFYLAFAVNQTSFLQVEALWSAVAFTILISIIIHGFTAAPIMKHLKNEIPVEKIPE